MTELEKKAKPNLEKQTISQLLYQFEITTDMDGENIPTVRGWLLDEIECRYPKQVDAWLDSDYPADNELRKYIFQEVQTWRRSFNFNQR